MRKLVLEVSKEQLGAAGRIVVSLSLQKGADKMQVNALSDWGSQGPFA